MKVVAVIALALALMGCTITPEAILGLVGGGVTGGFIAGPIGAAVGAGVGIAAVGAGAGIVAAPMVGVARS